MVGTAYLPVALGSPGPLDKKTPSGSILMISCASVEAGTTTISQLKFDKEFRIFKSDPSKAGGLRGRLFNFS